MSYYLYLVETKNEYTTQLINALTPLIHEGIQSLYEDASSIRKGEELRIFQELLRVIPKWNTNIINNETKRILRQSNKGDVLPELIRAVIKANIMLLTNTHPEKVNQLNIQNNITTEHFIHTCYIEVARNVFNNPYLYHTSSTEFEQQQNQLKALDLIGKSIKDAIRSLLPVNDILNAYVGESFNQISEAMSENAKMKLLLGNDRIRVAEKVQQLVQESIQKPLVDDRLLDEVSQRIQRVSEQQQREIPPAPQVREFKVSQNPTLMNDQPEENNVPDDADCDTAALFTNMEKASIEQVYGANNAAKLFSQAEIPQSSVQKVSNSSPTIQRGCAKNAINSIQELSEMAAKRSNNFFAAYYKN